MGQPNEFINSFKSNDSVSAKLRCILYCVWRSYSNDNKTVTVLKITTMNTHIRKLPTDFTSRDYSAVHTLWFYLHLSINCMLMIEPIHILHAKWRQCPAMCLGFVRCIYVALLLLLLLQVWHTTLFLCILHSKAILYFNGSSWAFTKWRVNHLILWHQKPFRIIHKCIISIQFHQTVCASVRLSLRMYYCWLPQ